ncbi:hypothetical protein SprV_0401523700 [Sparganum proliferum]
MGWEEEEFTVDKRSDGQMHINDTVAAPPVAAAAAAAAASSAAAATTTKPYVIIVKLGVRSQDIATGSFDDRLLHEFENSKNIKSGSGARKLSFLTHAYAWSADIRLEVRLGTGEFVCVFGLPYQSANLL